jgi:hypothetical protein
MHERGSFRVKRAASPPKFENHARDPNFKSGRSVAEFVQNARDDHAGAFGRRALVLSPLFVSVPDEHLGQQLVRWSNEVVLLR